MGDPLGDKGIEIRKSGLRSGRQLNGSHLRNTSGSNRSWSASAGINSDAQVSLYCIKVHGLAWTANLD
jgi:hypothetical protein